VLALVLAPAVAGQEKREDKPDEKRDTPVFGVDLDVVNVAVTVRDPRNKLVTDLTADDFTVLEDGRPQALRLFARAVEPGHDDTLSLDLGLLMDTSESMLTQLKLSQEAAVRFLEAIPRARQLLTIFFDQDIRISRYDSENQQGLFERIHELKGSGNTALYDAIAVYLSRVEDSPGRKVLVLFTDGEDTCSTVTVDEVDKMVQSSSVVVYPIAFLEGFANGGRRTTSRIFLHRLAALTGGEVFTPSASGDIPGIYQKILEELAGQYVLGFVSDNPKHDGKFRKLEVRVKRKNVTPRHRAGYYAPAPPPR
jgi:Ca-activated chloride channel family protein